MSEPSLVFVAIMVGAPLVMLAGAVGLYARALVKVPQGHALVVSRSNGVDVRFSSTLVIPVFHRAELIDIRTKTLVVGRRGKAGVRCRDGIRVDLEMTFYLRIEATQESVLKVARSLGCARAGELAVLDELLSATLANAIEATVKQHDYETLQERRKEFKDEVIEEVGRDLGGFMLEGVALDHLEQTPIEHLDPNDILDAQGIRAITERTTRESIRRNELERERLRDSLRE